MISREEALDFLKSLNCPENVIEHSICVSKEAVLIAETIQKNGIDVDVKLVEIGALLHDVGRSVSHGMDHAVIGSRLIEDAGFDPRLVNIVKKHIGAGLDSEDISLYNLPEDNYIPETLEEQIVSHADNLFKGSEKITLEKRVEIMKNRGNPERAIKRVIYLAEKINEKTSKKFYKSDLFL